MLRGVHGAVRSGEQAVSERVDVERVARRIADGVPFVVSVEELQALARVVLAAGERVKAGHSDFCDHCRSIAPRRCSCGHDALAAAREGEK